MFRDRNTRTRVVTPGGGPSMTKQAHKDECDINHILQKYRKTGLISHYMEGGTYQDLPSGLEFHQAMNLMLSAERTFEQMPSHIRRRFNNDAATFLSFCENPENLEEMYDLGLAARPAPALPGGEAGSMPASPPGAPEAPPGDDA